MRASGWDFISHMIKDCQIIIKLTQSKTSKQFDEDEPTNRAVVYSLLNLGELLKTCSDADKASMSAIPWKSIIGFRNRAAHGFHNVNLKLAWYMAIKRIPPLLIELQKKSAELAEQAEIAEKAKLAEIAKQAKLAEQAKITEQAENPKNPPAEE
ncbi:MAG: DUF86 domain-containing protein [Defluviitaleaceae bacterium]|nr:DUF86 domain-containing protein [Defluviitaleaceae bacterium]